MHKAWKVDPSVSLKAGSGFKLADVDPSSTPGFKGDKQTGADVLAAGAAQLTALQQRLYARGVEGDERRVLLILQGMDTSGKDGTVRHVVGTTHPEGIALKSFKAPTPWERRHDFLWRVARQVPAPGMIGVFNRSHYEDVLIQRVHQMAPAAEIERRYGAINEFEAGLVDRGITVLKVMLHISPEEQKLRLQERLDRPDKFWKYNPSDVTERGFWNEYQESYQIAITRTSTEAAPWYVVPADRKWFARIAVQRLLDGVLEGFDLKWPLPSFDLATERKRLKKS
ncbi:PPK2 family polyphosphate kinase [Gryllotalpicola protaetiae]|uniref:Polyphosphate kinase 2 family protein n=1 Tax=Gryllotalpicola protaetiae TaxID=2419771 RepID=A0A387BNW0_9MICO|nr:PPK2 family polyphosphate kinase [Gryllotalpicola protaetiae]AYG02696.1 polyphosphate kinase 2 family protein [Gryllotalpicola protaetiae]